VEDARVTYEYIPWRNISKSVMEFYDYRTKVDPNGDPVSVGIPYGEEAILARYFNFTDRKDKWRSFGKMSEAGLGGVDKFAPGCANSITICEGGLKAAAHREIMGPKYPAVYLKSSSSAVNDCKKGWEFLNSFKRIYIAMDNDEAGTKAAKAIAALFDFNKVYNVKLQEHNDVNDYLESGNGDTYRTIWQNARRFVPEGIISSYSEIEKLLDEEKEGDRYTLPFPTWDRMADSFQAGETVVITADTGVGKSEVCHALEYHFLKTTDVNIGIIHIEEPKLHSYKKIAGYELKLPVHLSQTQASKDEIKAAYRKATGRDDRLHIYSHFGSDDPSIFENTIRFLVAACGCKIIVLDHISMVISGHDTDNERKDLDRLATHLATLARDLGCVMIIVSHVNDEGRTRGSRILEQIARIHVHLDRDKTNTSEFMRRLTTCTFKKSYRAGATGPAGKLIFDPESHTLSELPDNHEELPV